jgi:hypothetical protein
MLQIKYYMVYDFTVDREVSFYIQLNWGVVLDTIHGSISQYAIT